MRTTQTMTISLPPALLAQFDAVRKVESRTRSELVREALRVYIERRYPEVEPAREEVAALRRGRAAFLRGDSISLAAMLSPSNGMESPSRRPSAKGLSKAARKRSAQR